MREIKFRCWDKRTKKMKQVGEISFNQVGEVSHIVSVNGEIIGYDFVLMEYTGLRDKNGREIYEGDIVEKLTDDFKLWNETKEPIGEVFYENGCFCVGRKLKVALGSVKCEVIGNVYERKA